MRSDTGRSAGSGGTGVAERVRRGRASRAVLPLLPLVLAAVACGRQEPAPLGRLAFVRGDTLFLQALPDGQPRVHGTGRNLAAPRWSSSGEWLAFRAADGLHLTRSDGSGGQQLAGPEATAFAWAPTDDRLAYVAGGNLIVARAGGMAVALVERTRDASTEGLAWSADGQWLAYGLRPTPTASPAARPALGRVPARGGAGGGLVPLPSIAFVGAPLLRGWTSDGTRILVLLPAGDLRTGTVASGGAPLYALPVAGGAPERLADSVLPYPDFVAPRPRGAARQSAAVAFVAGGGEATWRDKTIVVAQLGGGAPVLRAISSPAHSAISPAWSPDGTWLAWSAMPQLPLAGGVDADVALGSRKVMVGSAAGDGSHSLGGPPGRQEMPRWSADGRQLLIARVDSTGAASLWLVQEGEPGRLLTTLGHPGGGWTGTWGHVAWDQVVDYWPGRPPSSAARPPGA